MLLHTILGESALQVKHQLHLFPKYCNIYTFQRLDPLVVHGWIRASPSSHDVQQSSSRAVPRLNCFERSELEDCDLLTVSKSSEIESDVGKENGRGFVAELSAGSERAEGSGGVGEIFCRVDDACNVFIEDERIYPVAQLRWEAKEE
jgi:hypothetical protein